MINDHTETFPLKRELLTSRATAMTVMRQLRQAAVHVLNQIQESTNQREDSMAESLSLSPSLPLVRSPNDFSDTLQPSIPDDQEPWNGENFTNGFT
jgi:hypothetical protein